MRKKKVKRVYGGISSEVLFISTKSDKAKEVIAKHEDKHHMGLFEANNDGRSLNVAFSEVGKNFNPTRHHINKIMEVTAPILHYDRPLDSVGVRVLL